MVNNSWFLLFEKKQLLIVINSEQRIFQNMDDEINFEMIKKTFSEALKQAIKRKFKIQLSIVDFTIQYNLQFHHPISNETARKWITGISLPQMDKLIQLKQWLNLQFPILFDLPKDSQQHLIDQQDLVNKIEEIYASYKDKMDLDIDTLLTLKELIKKLWKKILNQELKYFIHFFK